LIPEHGITALVPQQGFPTHKKTPQKGYFNVGSSVFRNLRIVSSLGYLDLIPQQGYQSVGPSAGIWRLDYSAKISHH
jgi:hypothetical protein